MFGHMKVAVVIPAFEPGEGLKEVVAQVHESVDMVVIVDDGSRQPLCLEGVGQRPIRLVRHERNLGVGAAIMRGYQEAIMLECDVAVVMAADGQMDPADTPALLAPLLDGKADYVKGDRLSHPACRFDMPRVRRFGNYCLTFLTRLMTGLKVMDSQCGYTALWLKQLGRLPLDWIYPRYGFPNDMLAAMAGAGLRVVDVTVRPIYRGENSGIHCAVAALVYPLILLRGLIVRWIAWWRRRRAEANLATP